MLETIINIYNSFIYRISDLYGGKDGSELGIFRVFVGFVKTFDAVSVSLFKSSWNSYLNVLKSANRYWIQH